VTVAVADLVALTDPQDPPCSEGRDAPHVQTLVRAAREGSREAFGDLVTLHQRAAFHTALAALHDREDAEDVAQDAFVVAWQKLAGFRGDSTFRTWLLTIVWRKALDRRRQRQAWWTRLRSSRAGADGEAFDPIGTIAGDGLDPEQTALARDLARQIRRAIERLSPRLRDTLLLASSGEHTYDEIAVMLGVPPGTVKWRVAEARRLVARHVDRGETS
jgi:RNA polymerase sigma-70 factor (ECF subfamily)